MIKAETFRVTTDNGPRPAGDPGECFYCRRKAGDLHAVTCVCRKQTVVIEYTVRVCVEVPAYWREHEVEFHRNDSSWCATNLIAELAEAYDRDDGPCLCSNAEARFVRLATEEDEENMGYLSKRGGDA